MTRLTATRLPFVLLVTGLLVGGLLLLLALNTASAANELRRSSLATKDQEVSADVAELRVQVAADAAPANLARAAEALGMVPAGHAAFIVELPDGRTVLRGHAKRVSDTSLLDIPAGTQHVAPKPTTRAEPSPTRTPTSASTATRNSSPTSTSTSTSSRTPTGHADATKKHGSPTKRPTSTASSTPTPTITISGGDR